MSWSLLVAAASEVVLATLVRSPNNYVWQEKKGMYVCNCAGVTQRALQSRLQQGATSMKELQAELGVCRGCGKCAREVGAVLKGRQNAEPDRTDSWSTPAGRVATY